MHDRSRPHLGRRFLTVWVGQTLSGIGSTMSAVGVAVYVFLETGSAVWLGVLSALPAIPVVLVAPFAGVIDRYSRRSVMLAADAFAAIGPAVALGLALAGRLEVWHLAVAALLASLGNAVQMPAAQAAVPLLVTPAALGRANGLNQLGPAIGFVLGPALATPLVAAWGVQSVLIVDAVTFVAAVTSTALVRFGDVTSASPGIGDDDHGWRSAWDWLRTTGRPLLTLLVAMAVVNCCLGFYNVALEVLAFDVAGSARAGVVFATAGATMIAGSLWVGRRGVPHRRMRALVCGLAVMGAGAVVSAGRPSMAWLVAGVVVALAVVPALNASTATMFHERVPQHMQGRVFGLRFAIGRALDPVGAVLGGLVIGTRDSSGAALVLMGVALALVVLAACLRRSTAYAALDTPIASDASMELAVTAV
jgi:MFS family permease